MANTIKWGKAVPVTVGKNSLPMPGRFTYTSKDGRFVIERREYQLPTSSVAYILTDSQTGYRDETCERLSEAKESAQIIVEEEVQG